MSGDAFSPDVGQTLDEQGRPSYDFAGHVHAAGLDLDAGDTSSPPDDRRVRWLRTTDGAAVADVAAWSAGGADSVLVEALRATAGHAVSATLQALAGSDPDVVAQLAAEVSAGDLAAVTAYAFPDGDVTVIDGAGRSSFVQSTGVAERVLSCGAGSLHFAASTVSNPLTVAHGLGAAPTSILLTGQNQGDGRLLSFGYFNVGANTFDVIGRDWVSTGVTKNVGFSWLAVL